MQVFDIADTADQEWTSVLVGQTCRLRLRWLTAPAAWFLDLDVAGVPRVRSRKVVLARNLLAPYRLGIGVIAAAGRLDITRASLPAGDVRLYHMTEGEWNEALRA